VYKVLCTCLTYDGSSHVRVMIHFHDKTKIATGGKDDNVIQIWDATTGKLLSTFEHKPTHFCSFTSTSGKLTFGSREGSITIFDTATWKQITVLEGHTNLILSVSLFQNDRLLASVSWDKTVRLWDLDTNLPVGPLIQREHVDAAAISADGKLLVTFSWHTKRHYVWDIHTILKASCPFPK
jgi:WD40 repeat protein